MKRKLLFKVALAVLVCLFITIPLSNRYMRGIHEEVYLHDEQTDMESLTVYVKNMMLDYEALPWLLEYWQAHMEEYMEQSEMEKTIRGADPEVFSALIDLKKIPIETVETLSKKDQRLFAWSCYYQIWESMNALSFNLEPTALYCWKADEGSANSATCLIWSGFDDDEIVDLSLGDEMVFNRDKHPEIVERISHPEDKPVFEELISSVDGRRYTYCIVPIIIDGKVACFITYAHDWTEIVHQMNEGSKRVQLFIGIIMALISMILLVAFYRLVIRRIVRIDEIVSDYEKNKDTERATDALGKFATDGDEIGSLAESISDMSLELQNYMEAQIQNAQEKEKQKTEFDIASMIQKNQLLTGFEDFCEDGRMDVFMSMKPVKEVGGDFYDCVRIDDDHVCMVVADVSDKGIAAALYMMAAKTMIRSELLRGESPGQALAQVNEQLSNQNDAMMFVTVYLVAVDLRSGEAVIVNAGHEDPLLKKKDGTWQVIKYSHEIAIGVLPGTEFEERHYRFEPGDSLFACTDGVIEAENAKGERFENERLVETLNRAESEEGIDAKRRIACVDEAIRDFAGEAAQFDDITMICFTYKRA